MEQKNPKQSDDIVSVTAQPVPAEVSAQPRMPVIVAKTVNLTINVARGAAEPLRRRYHRHYHPRHRWGKHHLIADAAFAVGVVALLAVNAYVFFWRDRPIPSKVRIAWSAESAEVRSGDRIALALAYRYEGNEELRDTTVALDVPDGLTVESIAPGAYDIATRTVRMGVIAPGTTSRLEIRGYTDAPDGSTLRIGATFHGKGATTTERTTASHSVNVRGVALAFDFDLPPIIPASGIVHVGVRYRSEAAVPLLDVIVRPSVVAPLTLIGGGEPWGVPRTIASGSEGIITMDIRTGNAGTFPIAMAISGNRGNLGSATFPITVVAYPIDFAVVTQGDGPAVVRLGQEVEVGASYYATAGSAVPTINARAFRVVVDGPRAEDARIRASGAEARPASIRWPFRVIRSAGETTGEAFMFTPPTSLGAISLSEEARAAYRFTPEIILTEDAQGIPTARIVGEAFDLALAGKLRLSAFARYFTPEGDQIGRGPLPPRVGQTTKYWVTWEAESVIEASGGVVVRATLPDGVEWTGKTAATAGDRLAFDQTTREVRWVVGTLARTGGDVIPATASFELAVVPRAEHVGSAMPMLGKTIVEGVGQATKVELRAEAPAVTINLTFDQRAKNKGIVTR